MSVVSRDPEIRPVSVEEWPVVERLLESNRLPVAGARDHLVSFVVAVTRDGAIVGCAGVEAYGQAGLLRSVAVDADHRKLGLGRRLVAEAIEWSRREGLEVLFLLTTDAEAYFARLGFVEAARSELTPGLAASAELQGACPASARAMRLGLTG